MTSAQPLRLSCSILGWWVPVWITVAEGASARDVLEDAVLELMRADVRSADRIARVLCVDELLVESALAALCASGVVEVVGGGYRPRSVPEPPAGHLEREGWVFWDPVAERPLIQLWAGPRPQALPSPDGWEAVEPDGIRLAPPRMGSVDARLSLLPGLPELVGLEGWGSGFRVFDAEQVRSIRRDPRRVLEPGRAYAPVELRPVTGPVVWRPAIVRFARVQTSLDPGGWSGLLERLAPEGRAALERRRREATVAIAPAVLEAAGYRSLTDLDEAAELHARRELGDRWRTPAWAAICDLVHAAEINATVARAIGAGWRTALHGWADVLDALTASLHQLVRADLSPEAFAAIAALTPDERRRRVSSHAATLGASTDRVLDTIKTNAKLASLESTLASTPMIGPRIAGLGVVVVFGGDACRRVLTSMVDALPSFFDDLDRANVDRRKIVHLDVAADRGDNEADVDVASFRQRLIRLIRAAMTGA